MLNLMVTGFVLGWSVAWPPGPINAEMARRCLAGGFWAGYGLILGACTGDGIWALLVALGMGAALTAPLLHTALIWISLALLAWLTVTFARRAREAFVHAAPEAPPKFDSHRASFLLGLTLAATSPWNITFWLAAIGRPDLAGLGLPALLAGGASVILGAATWGLVWAGAILLGRGRMRDGDGRWAAVAMNGLTALVLAWFLVSRLIGLLPG
jgi:threonine/homoserine/homoserine lactone efflux protein